ncbi:hypothetical protein DX933_12900 [Ornithinibacillus gellani]|uniref:protease inhibitor I9 family protein n=1 Tax=Ornithinibacillus gellani TaxID=2293253 RepID=UPI000F466C73|nr:protease inhibitor I9 family protein [Ornithinibacillus gellani]TQS74220.1 hypothetical protein DX933_12900 [Ornithinibacillus gellani]
MSIYIDPQIDLHNEETIKVIIEFKTKPAKVAVATSTTGLTLEQAKELVEKSHTAFQEELENLLESKQLPYTITNSYKVSLNGVALELPGIAINELLASNTIKAIYIDRVISIPKPPIDTRYQI